MGYFLNIFAVFYCLVLLLPIISSSRPKVQRTTADRIRGHGYPVETHPVVTSDGYILTMFRIPYSPKLRNINETKPVVYLDHGIFTSSDSFVLTGPESAIAFLLADAGYDVWMVNNRGNTYSRKNVHISPSDPAFWDFSFHEIAIFDLPASFDYVLNLTSQPDLYFIGHSQGATLFLALMSTKPSYNEKIKIAFMLSPIGYINNAKSPLAVVLAPFLGHPTKLTRFLSKTEFLAINETLSRFLLNIFCSGKIFPLNLCASVLFIGAGMDSQYFNYTLLPQIWETHPAGTSTKSFIHYLQEYVSGHFRQYDYGPIDNLRRYNQVSPPDYRIENISAKVVFYYGANDMLAAVYDIQRLAVRLPNLMQNNLVPIPAWNHIDFIFSTLVKSLINKKIIKIINENEARQLNGLSRCAMCF